jgi:hypothetical protein
MDFTRGLPLAIMRRLNDPRRVDVIHHFLAKESYMFGNRQN